MNRLCRVILLGIVFLCVLPLTTHAEHRLYSGPWSRTAIALEAERGLFLQETDADSAEFTLADSAEALATDSTVAQLTLEPPIPREARHTSTWTAGGVPIAAFAAMEAALAGMTYATVRQPKGGYYFGGFMYFTAPIVPLLAGADGLEGEPHHTLSLLSYGVAAVYLGSRMIALEKHPPVDRPRMFEEAFLGLNISFFLPGMFEWTLRKIEGKK